MLIHEHASDGDVAGVATELARGVDVDARDGTSKKTPLMQAVESPRAGPDVVRVLIERCADVNAVGGLYAPQPELSFAVSAGNVEQVTVLLDAGADIRYRKPERYDVLIDAMYGRPIATDPHLVPLVRLLIDRGARLDSVTTYEESALSVASNNGRFDAVRVLLEAGADPAPLEWTPLMRAIALGSVAEVEAQLAGGADLTVRDFWSRTPWLLGLQAGDVAKARRLLAAGADRADRGRCGKVPLTYPIAHRDVEMLRWLLSEGFDPDQADDFKTTPLMEAAEQRHPECAKLLIDAGANIHLTNHVGHQAITLAGDLAVVRLLVQRGADLNDISDEMRAALTRLPADGRLRVSREDYLAANHRRFGERNPDPMNLAFWKAMVASGANAWAAKQHFGDTKRLDEPVWCFQRFGKSINELPDGRIIEIGGEHEDHYDPDFCIYNDVGVHHGDGTSTSSAIRETSSRQRTSIRPRLSAARSISSAASGTGANDATAPRRCIASTSTRSPSSPCRRPASYPGGSPGEIRRGERNPRLGRQALRRARRRRGVPGQHGGACPEPQHVRVASVPRLKSLTVVEVEEARTRDGSDINDAEAARGRERDRPPGSSGRAHPRRRAMTKALRMTGLAKLLGVMMLVGVPGAAIGQTPDLPKLHLKVVGSSGIPRQFELFEKPFFTKTLPERSGGKITTDFVSREELGLKGFDDMRVLRQGTLDIGTSQTLYVGGDEPFAEGVDLAGLFGDIDTAFKGHMAYKNALDERLQKKFGLKLMTLWPYPAQVIYCRPPIKTLSDLKGKKVRVFGRTLGDVVEHVGGASVTITFGEVYEALERGAADCGVTGTLSGNAARWYEVTTHLFVLPLGWSTTMHTMNLALWNRLDAKTKEFLRVQFTELEKKLWDFGRESTQDGINCNTGVGECKYGYKGKMTLGTPSAADVALRDQILRDTVIPRWLKRCGKDCAEPWNETAGKVVGIRMKAP